MQAFLKTGKVGLGDGAKPSTSKGLKEPKNVPASPWVEKYRPRTVDDVVEQGEVIEVLRQCMAGGDFPNLLFYGPPGTGKTSTILAAARQLFGSIYKERILELNASDERGIQVVRDKVKSFAQLTASSTKSDGKSCPPFKIVILDEADSMTHAAQSALRRTMEKESHSTRFCLICNYLSRIIQPLTSRCTKFRFKPLGQEKLIERLELICKNEDVTADKYVLTKLVEASGGDLRRAITCLQSATRLKGKGLDISINDIYEVTGVIPEEYVSKFLNICETDDFNQIQDYVDEFLLEGYSTVQLIEQLSDMIVFSDSYRDAQKSAITEKLGECSYRLLEGGSEYIQLIDLCCTIMQTNQMR